MPRLFPVGLDGKDDERFLRRSLITRDLIKIREDIDNPKVSRKEISDKLNNYIWTIVA